MQVNAARDITSDQSSLINPIFKNCLNILDEQLFKLFLPRISSAIPIAFLFSGSAVWAKEQAPVFPAFQNSPEFSAPPHANSAKRNYAIADYTIDFDRSVSTPELHSLAASTDEMLQSVDSAGVWQQSAAALTQPFPRSATAPVVNRIAQADTSTPESISPPQNTPTPPEPPSHPDTSTPQDIHTPSSEPSEPSTPSEPSESASNPAASNRWRFSVEPYFFVPLDVHADVTVAGRRTSLDLGLGDILNLDRAFDAGLRLQAQNNRWGVILDGFYVYAENGGSLGRTFSSGSIFQYVQQTSPERLQGFVQQFSPQRLQQLAQLSQRIGLNTPVGVSADGRVSVRQITVDVAVSYRAVDTSLNSTSETTNTYPRLVVSPILGVRTNFLRQTIDVDTIRINDRPIPDQALPPVDRSFRFSRTLVDPLIGTQLELALSERWMFGLRADVSGFNIGANRNWTWNLLIGPQYNISPDISLQLAYRFNSFDFEDGEGLRRTRLNLFQNGITLSGIFRF